MKDLIAKLQMDANCALGAIWMHIDAQAARIAELEAQIAAASAPANTDNLREALKLAVRQNSCDMLMTGEEIRKCEAALNSTALQAPVREVPGWQPIETAPKDGTRVLLYGTRYSMLKPASKILAGNFNRGCWWADGTDLSHVTHWAPLPAAPVQEPKP